MCHRSASRHRPRLARLGLITSLAVGCDVSSSDAIEGSSDAGESAQGSTSTTADATGETDGTTTDGEPLTRVEQILADLTIGMYECPDLVWPGDVIDNYRSRQVLLTSVEENKGWMWNDQVLGNGDPPRITTGPLDGLPLEWSSTFNVGVINGATTLGISLDETALINDATLDEFGELYRDFASVLTFHEAFHFLSDQNDWTVQSGSRSSPYPEPWEPRYLRAALRTALRAWLEDGENPAAAAYWQSRVLAEFPDQMAEMRRYDVLEGAAEYASIVSSVLAVEGCAASEEVIVAEAIAHLDAGFQGIGFDPDREPYDLGVLAGLLLRQTKVGGWELAQEGGITPVEQVLEGITPEDQPDDVALQMDVQAAVTERNVLVGMEIDPMLEALASADYRRVVVSSDWIVGSFGIGGFYYLPDHPDTPDVFLRLSAVLDPPSGVAIELVGETVLVGVDTPCALTAAGMVLTLPVADVEVSDGKTTSTAATATFIDLAVESAMDLDGLEWLCPVDAGGAGDTLPEPGVRARSERPLPHMVRLSGGRTTAIQ